jgi:3-phenylpropionate/cinnamic acid dioxygenase small subunit
VNPEDRLALTDLVHRYAAWVDDRRFDDVAGLFVEDATLSLPDPPRSLVPSAVHRGLDEIGRAITSVAAAARTQHAIVGEVYDAGPLEDVARGRISCIAHHWSQRDEQITNVAWHVRYDDQYVRTADGWRFRSRTLTIDAIETRPVRRLRPDGT